MRADLLGDWNREPSWTTANIGSYFFNTVIVVGFALVIVMLLGAMCAYYLARYEFKGSEPTDIRVDVVHPNPMGHRIAAHGAADQLFPWLFPGQKKPASLDRQCSSYRAEEFASVRGY